MSLGLLEILTLKALEIAGTREYKAKNEIVTENTVTINSGADVTFKAGMAVILKPGFSVEQGAVFNGKIDPALQLQTVDSEVEYVYDSQGNRVKKSYSDLNSEKYYVRDAAGNTIAVYDENGSQQYVNLFGADVFGKYSRNDGNYFYYVKDHLGSTRAVVNSNGDVAEAYEYYPFGKIARSYVTGNGTDEKFTGKELDNDAGERIYYFGKRNYDGDVIRWWSVDPLAYKYPAWSPFNYVLCDPVNKFDPNGMAPIDKRTKEFISGSEAAALMDATFAKFFAEGNAEVFVGNDSESIGGGIRDLFAAWSGGYEVTYTNNVLRFGGFYNNVTKHGFDQGSKRVYSVDYKLTNDEDVVIDSFDPEPEKFGRTKNGELLMSLNFTSKGKIATSLTFSVSDMKKYLSQYGYTLYQDKNENWFVRSVDSEEYKKDHEEKE